MPTHSSPSPTVPPDKQLTDEQFDALTQSVRDAIRTLEQTTLDIGKNLLRLRESRAYRPDSFNDYCLENFDMLWREAYRYSDAYQLVIACQQQLGEAPRHPKYAERVLTKRIKKDPTKLKDVQRALKKMGVSMRTATAAQIGQAVNSLQPKRKPKTRPGK